MKQQIIKHEWVKLNAKDTLKNYILEFTMLAEKFGKNSTLTIGYTGYGGTEDYDICFYREETDKEFIKRVKKEEAKRKKEKQLKDAQEKSEKELYLKLKKKYGEL